MTLLEIYNRAVFYIYGDQAVPAHITTQLQGGIIPGIHRRIQEDFNYWFMEAETGTDTVIGQREYDMPLHFKTEIVSSFLDDNSVLLEPLIKLRGGQADVDFPDQTERVEYPTHYEIWGTKLRVYPLPSVAHFIRGKGYSYIPKPLYGLDTPVVMSIGVVADTQIQTTAFNYRVDGISLAAVLQESAFTDLEDVAADLWGTYLMSITTAGAITLTQGTVMNGADEAAAILGIAETPAGQCRIGYITMTTAAGVIFDATTDSPEGGATGNVSLETNYYPDDVYTDLLLDEASELIVFMTCLEIEQMLEHNPQNIQMYMQRIEEELKRLKMKHSEKSFANFRELEYRDV